MLIQRAPRFKSSEITDPKLYVRRREFIAGAAALALAPLGLRPGEADAKTPSGAPLKATRNAAVSSAEPPTDFQSATTYNNFYEFGTAKDDPAANAGRLRTKPWTVVVDGECEKPGRLLLDDLLRPHPLEERVYRLRCVEAWSMVIPWIGFPLGDLVKRFQPTSRAKFVEFTTLLDPKQMPGQRYDVLDWPYVEGLRMDEAMHPLAILAVGLYGKPLPNQNGAPLRLVVPWKYGFKSIKSIVRIRFTERMPVTSWAKSAPNEYGFFANVNPAVDHPRWSQKSERRIGSSNFLARQPTLAFNGYADEVAGLYSGLDLRRWF